MSRNPDARLQITATESYDHDFSTFSWRSDGDLSVEEVSSTWLRFLTAVRPEAEANDVFMLPSWQRSHSEQPHSSLPVRLRRISDLNRRLEKNEDFLYAARPHLQQFSVSMGLQKHVVYVTDLDGVILESFGNDIPLKVYGLLPGYDWSESVMGTNGAGTALCLKRPVAVLGPDYYQLPFRDSACLGSVIASPDGRVLGALDLRVHLRELQARHLREALDLSRRIADTWTLLKGRFF